MAWISVHFVFLNVQNNRSFRFMLLLHTQKTLKTKRALSQQLSVYQTGDCLLTPVTVFCAISTEKTVFCSFKLYMHEKDFGFVRNLVLCDFGLPSSPVCSCGWVKHLMNLLIYDFIDTGELKLSELKSSG